ncbi:uncharacterized protein LOC135469591 [Liolophura sinensis]|uniref:uncharacterized protein LOC135469591 n=1 Tax=Liolophura sinensis TaxID=3198878 RepID=UPI003158F69F
MASKTDATVKKKNKPLNKRPNLASKKTFHLSKPHQFNVCGEKYECSVDDGREGKTEYQLTAYVNPSFSLHEKDRVQPPAQARDEVTFAPHRRPGQFQDFVPRKTATNTISARIRENEISLPIMNTLVYQRPFFDPAENADSLVHIDVDDRIPLQPKSRHSKLAKIWDELNCCTKHRCEVRKDHISWPVVGSLVVRGPEGELEGR